MFPAGRRVRLRLARGKSCMSASGTRQRPLGATPPGSDPADAADPAPFSCFNLNSESEATRREFKEYGGRPLRARLDAHAFQKKCTSRPVWPAPPHRPGPAQHHPAPPQVGCSLPGPPSVRSAKRCRFLSDHAPGPLPAPKLGRGAPPLPYAAPGHRAGGGECGM